MNNSSCTVTESKTHLSSLNSTVSGSSAAAQVAAAQHAAAAAYASRMNMLMSMSNINPNSFSQALAQSGVTSLSSSNPGSRGMQASPVTSSSSLLLPTWSPSSAAATWSAYLSRVNCNRSPGQPVTCPLCSLTLKPNELNAHFYEEVYKMETFRSALRLCDYNNREVDVGQRLGPHDLDNDGHGHHESLKRGRFDSRTSFDSRFDGLPPMAPMHTHGGKIQPSSRWQTYQRVRQNRQNRLSGLLRCKRGMAGIGMFPETTHLSPSSSSSLSSSFSKLQQLTNNNNNNNSSSSLPISSSSLSSSSSSSRLPIHGLLISGLRDENKDSRMNNHHHQLSSSSPSSQSSPLAVNCDTNRPNSRTHCISVTVNERNNNNISRENCINNNGNSSPSTKSNNGQNRIWSIVGDIEQMSGSSGSPEPVSHHSRSSSASPPLDITE